MVSTSKSETFRRLESALPAVSSSRTARRFSESQKEAFFLDLDRLGSVAQAADELGIPRSTCYAWARAAGKTAGKPRPKFTAEQKDEFFTVLDRVGSVTVAARDLDLNINTAFQWAYKANAVTKRTRNHGRTNQRITQAQKDEFFKVLDRVGSVTVAAVELGLNPQTCFNWTRKLGITSSSARLVPGRKEEFLKLRAQGVSIKEATVHVGVDRKTARVWEHRMIKVNGRYVYPDKPPVAYNQHVTKEIAQPFIIPASGKPVPKPVVRQSIVEQEISSRYLSQPEREHIADRLRAKASMRAIARELGRSPGSISREISRNRHQVLGYMPHGAQRAAASRRTRPKPSKLAKPGPLRDYVLKNLRDDWSPEQISNHLIKEFPHDPSMRVSHETIYQALYFQARGGLKREIQVALRTGRTRRKSHRTQEQRTQRFRDPMINISERPAQIEDRAVPGHWEGDLVRHEALFYRAEVEDLRLCAVAAA